MIETRTISEKKDIFVHLQDSTRLLEVAAKRAIQQANMEFGIDEYGHSDRVKEWERSCCSIRIEFQTMGISGGMGGWSYDVVFKAWCERHYDEDDENEDE